MAERLIMRDKICFECMYYMPSNANYHFEVPVFETSISYYSTILKLDQKRSQQNETILSHFSHIHGNIFSMILLNIGL